MQGGCAVLDRADKLIEQRCGLLRREVELHIATFLRDAVIQCFRREADTQSPRFRNQVCEYVPNQFILHCDVLPARRIVAAPPLFIEKVTPFWAKRWLVSENRFGSCSDLPSNCRYAALPSG